MQQPGLHRQFTRGNEMHAQAATWTAKDWAEFPVFVEDLNAMIERICDDNVFIQTKTEAMRRVELTQSRAWLTNLAPTDNATLPMQRQS